MKPILVECGTFDLGNVGDVAMLQVAVERLRQEFPAAEIHVFTKDEERLARACAGVVPLDPGGRDLWCEDAYFVGCLWRLLPRGVQRRVSETQDWWRGRWPTAYSTTIAARERVRGRSGASVESFLRLTRRCGLYLVSGQASLADVAGDRAARILRTALLVEELGGAVALMGQGLGPLRRRDLVRLALRVLPRAILVGLREEIEGRRLLRSLGVDPSLIVMTGDDALELAHRERCAQLGTALGVHVRMAPLAIREARVVWEIQRVVFDVACREKIRLIGLPVSRHRDGTDDVATIEMLLADEPAASITRAGTPAELVNAIGRCRVVVTGAYHNAVFALAQGVQVVCLSGSEYYERKFRGLKAQFPDGCEIVEMHGPGLGQRLESAITGSWSRAPEARARLLEAAMLQVASGRAAYARLVGCFAQSTAGQTAEPVVTDRDRTREMKIGVSPGADERDA